MATWKKILREDYAVGTTDGLLDLSVGVVTNTATVTLFDQRSGAADGAGSESVALAFSDAFTVGVTGTDQIDIDLNADFTVTGDSGSITVDLNAASPTFAITASDAYLVTTASGGAVDITLDPSQWEYTITGSGPSSTTYNIGDNITYGSTIGSINAIVVAESTSGEITIDLDVAATTVKANGAGSSTFYTGETIDFTSTSLTPTVSVSGNIGSRTLTVDLEAKDVTINGDGASSDTWSASTNANLNLKSAANSGLTVAASANTWTIDQADVTITGTSNNATLSPTSGITFISTDNSVTSAITGGGDGNVVTVDLEATPQVTNIGDVTTNTSETYNITMTSATTTGDYAAFMDVGALQWKITDAGGTENAELIVNGDLTVTGVTTTLQTQNVIVEDKLITLANPDTGDGTTTSAAGGGIELKSGETGTVAYPSIVWNNTGELSGWQIQDHDAAIANAAPKEIATMQFEASTAPATAVKRGDFYFETDTDILYVCISS